MRSISLFTIVAALVTTLPANALYFYMDGNAPKCFFEELPKDTLVVGAYISLPTSVEILITSNFRTDRQTHLSGHYNAEQYTDSSRTYVPNEAVGISITVDEVFDNNHRVISQRGAAKGRFTFTAADSGEHRICFTPQGSTFGGWLGGGTGAPAGADIKFTLDLAIGETSAIESTDKGKMLDIVQKVRDLNGRLQDIRREQVFQRVWIFATSLFSMGVTNWY